MVPIVVSKDKIDKFYYSTNFSKLGNILLLGNYGEIIGEIIMGKLLNRYN